MCFRYNENNKTIYFRLNQKFVNNISPVTIERILTWIRRALAYYIKDTYIFNKLGKISGNGNISTDESLFANNCQKIWIIWYKNIYTGNIRVDIFKSRNTNDLKLFIENHIKI